MRAIVIREYGSTDVLRIEDVADPSLTVGQVEITVHAAGLNFSDVMARLGHYKRGTPIPYIGGFEVAGVISKVASDVTDRTVGERVIAMTRSGGFAERIAADARDTLRLPDAMSFEEGAAIPVAGTTSWAALVSYGNVQPGERVLIKAAAGGVGVAAVQLAKRAGAEVWGAASPGKHQFLEQLGVDATVDYTTEGWETRLPGFDLIMDAIGGRSFAQSYDLLRSGGRLVIFGAASSFEGGQRSSGADEAKDFRLIEGLSSANLLMDSKSLIGLDQRVLWDDRGTIAPWLAPLGPVLEEGSLKAVISEVLPLEEVAKGHEIISARGNLGKVILTMET